jgi:hypothetical protein
LIGRKTGNGYVCAICGKFTSGTRGSRESTHRVQQCVWCGIPTCDYDLPHDFCRTHFHQLPVPDQENVRLIITDHRNAVRQLSLRALYVVLIGLFCALFFGLALQNVALAIILLSVVMGWVIFGVWRETQLDTQKAAQLRAISTKNKDLLLPITISTVKAQTGGRSRRFWPPYRYHCSVCGATVTIYGGVLQCPICLRVLCKSHFFTDCPNHLSNSQSESALPT